MMRLCIGGVADGRWIDVAGTIVQVPEPPKIRTSEVFNNPLDITTKLKHDVYRSVPIESGERTTYHVLLHERLTKDDMIRRLLHGYSNARKA